MSNGNILSIKKKSLPSCFINMQTFSINICPSFETSSFIMWILTGLFIILFSVKGEMTLCNAPVEFICKTPNPSSAFYIPGNDTEIQPYCSITKDFVKCLNTYDLLCKGRSSLIGLYLPSYYRRVRNILDKICDEKSSYYTALVTNLSCIKERITLMDNNCSKSNTEVLKAYDEFLLEHPTDRFSQILRKQCLSYVATTACLIRSIEQECGFSAYEIANEVMLETQIFAEKCGADLFLELEEAVGEIELEKKSKDDLKKYFVLKSSEMAPCSTPVEIICKTPNPSPEFYVPGNRTELQSYCSTTKDFVDCLNRYDLACRGRSQFMGLYPPLYYHRIRNILDKNCDERSSYHNALALHLPCIKERITLMDDICSKSNKRVMKAYDEFLLEHPNANIKDRFSRSLRTQCLSYVATTACVTRSIKQECGFSAYEIASEVMLETQILAEKCGIDIFLELEDAVDEFNLDRKSKKGLKKYFVVEIL